MQIGNSDVVQQATSILKLQASEGSISQVTGQVVPTFEMSPAYADKLVASNATSTTGASILLTTETTKRKFYITHAFLGFVKDATCDATVVNLTAVQGGVTFRLINFFFLPLTAERDNLYVTFKYPIPIDAGTAITATATFAAGTLTRQANVGGFYA